MHICFIIDNSPLTKQVYNFTGANNINTNMSILDSIKISVQTMLNQLRPNILFKDYQTLHLFVTSSPYHPVSSFQNGQLHFNYQLKEIKSSDSMTYPAETIKFAIQHISKFRILTETETLLGYRQGTIYEPVLIIFISYGLTLRKINQLEAANLHKYMRSQYKFAHYRLCYPSQTDKDRTQQKYRQQLENTAENKKLCQIIDKLNKGQHKNVVKYARQQCLTDLLIRLYKYYRPCLCGEFIFDCDSSKIKMQFPQYFVNSQLGSEMLMHVGDSNIVKVELLTKSQQNNPNSNINLIPIPLDTTLKQESSYNKTEYFLDEINGIQFYIDISKKLCKNLSFLWIPTISYNIGMNSKLVKLEKQLERLGIGSIIFPVFTLSTPLPTSTPTKKQKQLYLSGYLHYNKLQVYPPDSNYPFTLVLSYPDFPFLDWIINQMEGQRIDNRKIEKLLTDYHSNIPEFYYKFIAMYFKRKAHHKPVYNIYEIVAINNWNNPNTSQLNAIRSNRYKQLQIKEHILQSSRREEKILLEKLSNQNYNKHTNNVAECCPIYNELGVFKNFMRNTSKNNLLANKNKNQTKESSMEAIIGVLLNKICQFNQKYGIKSYFGGRQVIKQAPMTRQLDKYAQKNINTEDGRYGQPKGHQFQFATPNQSINYSPMGLPNKKLKLSSSNQQVEEYQNRNISSQIASQIKDSVERNKKDDIFESQMPEQKQKQKQYFFLDDSEECFREKLLNHPSNMEQQLYHPNSINVESPREHEYVEGIEKMNEIRQLQREMMRKKVEIQNRMFLSDQDNHRNLEDVYSNLHYSDSDSKNMEEEQYFADDNPHLNTTNENTGDKLKKAESLDYLSEQSLSYSKQPQYQKQLIQTQTKSSALFIYVNSIGKPKKEKTIKIKLNTNNIKQGKFEENIQKLHRIGLVKNLEKYIQK